MPRTERSGAADRPARQVALWVAAGAFIFLTFSIGALPGPMHRIGMADNGDLERVACEHHLQPIDPGSPPYFSYATTRWKVTDRGLYQCRGTGHYPTSYHLVIDWLVRLRTSGGTVDLRHQAWLLAALAATGIGVLAGLAARLTRAAGVSIGVGATLIVADTSFAGYYQSLYPEALALALLPLAVALAGWVSTAWSRSLRVGLGTAAGLMGTTALIALAKPQLAPVAVVMPAAVIIREILADRRRALIGLIAVSGALMLPLTLDAGHRLPDGISDTNAYDRVFQLALHHSTHPAADLRSLGLDPKLAIYRDVPFWNAVKPDEDHRLCFVRPIPNPPLTKAGCTAWRRFRSTPVTARIPLLLARHPIHSARTFADATVATMELVDPVFGNRTAGSGANPGARDVPVGVLLAMTISLEQAAPLLLPLAWFGALALAVSTIGLTRRRRGPSSGALDASMALAATAVLAMSCFLTALAGDGMQDIIKHNVFTAYLTALLAPLAAWAALERSRVRALPPHRDAATSDEEPSEPLDPHVGSTPGTPPAGPGAGTVHAPGGQDPDAAQPWDGVDGGRPTRSPANRPVARPRDVRIHR